MVAYKITQRISESVIDELLKIKDTKGLTAENIVEAAKNKDSSLHNLFDWNDHEAAQKWRLQQARVLVNEIKIYVEDKEYFAFENVNLSNDSEESVREYKPVVEILSNEVLKEQLLKAALRNLSYWEMQNAKFTELTPIIKASKRVRKNLETRWEKKKR